MKKVLIMLLLIGLASCGVGLGTAFSAPMGFTAINIGDGTDPGIGVTISPDKNTYTVSGGGTDIWNNNDSFEFAYVQISGDFDLSCRVTSLTTNNADGWSKAGLMARSSVSTDGFGTYALIAATSGNGISFQGRSSYADPVAHTGAVLGNYSGISYSTPVYLRLKRTGNIFNSFYSFDGVNWTLMDPVTAGNTEIATDFTPTMTDPIYVGLACCAHAAASLATAVFDMPYWGATQPDPANGTTGIPYNATTTLKWNALPFPDGPINSWKVYMGTEPNDLTVALVGTVNEPTREFTTAVLSSDTTYYWRVDGYVDDVNTTKGFYWSFATNPAKPVIAPEGQPQSILVAVNCPGSFTCSAISGQFDDQGDMTFVWKNKAGTTLKTESAVKTSTYQTTVRDTYYCEVSNIRGTTKSNEVTLGDDLGLPPFVFTAIGTGAQAGVGGSVSGNAVTVIGSGDDIWNAADGFQYAYIPVSGNGSMTARVVSLDTTNTDGWSKSGVMFRESLNANSTYAIMPVIPTSNTAADIFQYRTTTGGGAGATGSANLHAGSWVRVTRSGNTFTGFYSSDGVNFTQHGTVDISMTADPIYVGLAVCAHSTSYLNTTVFDSITTTYAASGWAPTDPQYSANAVTPENWINPVVDLTASWTKSVVAPCGATYKVYAGGSPDTMTLFGTTDPDVTQIVVPANTLPFNSTIYWRVDTVSGATTVAGTVWSFDTVKQFPVIRVDVAPLTVVNAGATANLTVKASTSTVPALIPMVKYEWFFGETKIYEGVPVGPDVNLNYDCPLAVDNVQLAKEGYYHCVVTNTVGPATSSNGLLLTHRLMLYYNFESAAGNVIPDQSASGFNASFVIPGGGTGPIYSLVDGGIGLGKAIRLYGQNDPNNAYITTNKKPMELGVSGNFPRSISVWAKTSVFTESGLYDMGAYADNQNCSLRTMPSTNGTWRVQYWGGGDRDAVVPSSYNNWTHFVHVYDGTNSQLYVNGKQVLNWATALDTNNGANLVLGRWNNDVQRFDGLLDDFRLFNYALTPAEAVQLYLNVKPGTICWKTLAYDFNGDCEVNTVDLMMFADEWMTDTLTNP